MLHRRCRLRAHSFSAHFAIRADRGAGRAQAGVSPAYSLLLGALGHARGARISMLRKHAHGHGALANGRRFYKSGTMRRADQVEGNGPKRADGHDDAEGRRNSAHPEAGLPITEMLSHAERMASLGTLAAGVPGVGSPVKK